MEDGKIRIQAGYKLYDAWWEMEVDLDLIAADAGRKVKEKVKDWDGEWIETVHVVYPLPRARKLIDLILDYGTDDDIEKADRCFGRNQKLYRIWREKLHGKKR